MERPLVVTHPDDSVTDIIREAGELAADLDIPLRVLTVVTSEEYDNDTDVLDAIGTIEGSVSQPRPEQYAKRVAAQAADDLLSDLDLKTIPIGAYVEDADRQAAKILEVARQHECDYIFMFGRRRSPTGKAIFGDTAQKVILNFDQYVVTTVR